MAEIMLQNHEKEEKIARYTGLTIAEIKKLIFI